MSLVLPLAIAVASSLALLASNGLSLSPANAINVEIATSRELRGEYRRGNEFNLANPIAQAVGEGKSENMSRSAFSNQVEVELLKVHRIDNPETGARDMVNVRFRVRRLVDVVGEGGRMYTYRSVARHPETSQSYPGLMGNSSGVLIFRELPINTWGEAHVWIPVPETVDVVDLTLHKTAMFEGIQIEDALAANATEAVTADAGAHTSEDNSQDDISSRVRPAFSNQVEVELLKVHRIDNPETGARDMVNVRFRVRRLVDVVGEGGRMYTYRSVARHPETNQSYPGLMGNSSGVLTFSELPINTWGEAHVWIPVPETVDVVDLALHKTAMFENVAILE